MSGILVVLEQTGGVLQRMSLEALAAAQQSGLPVTAVLCGAGASAVARDLAGHYACERIVALEHPLLESYTADAQTAALAAFITELGPRAVILPHTYQVRDYAPKLATRFGAVLVSDAIAFRIDGDSIVAQRQLFQGKLIAEYAVEAKPAFISVQSGAFRADSLLAGSSAVETRTPALDEPQIRQKPEPPFREAAREVDLSSAELIVAVGRGIKEEGNVPLAQELAQALGAELAASRPICDNGWLPMERQVGSSGQTVAPKLYLALGVSGAIQHLVGMKGSRCIVAINKDPNAPIFEVADYGIVGDLFEVVPPLIEEVKKAKG
jgi:electron transfer flavoprotein alpha subunit